MKLENMLMPIFAGFFVALVISWAPLLAYSIIASVVTVLPEADWFQATFFTWLVITIALWREV